ncbi:85/88 kDa calcium-independent phospholipase A2 [Mytilus coruscus]|uniref:85/88 kDa calcium-independent phospholipase A2 n=1 Tax=Mytilus coruscus TaxID=42192 RepID=A0A6J8DN35_MYTCO|nr:85/88 kDa calcium-independent phospholipase A2 [Mytilus coruscus]
MFAKPNQCNYFMDPVITNVNQFTVEHDLLSDEHSEHKQLVWEAARSSGAAPTYFKQARAFVDGGMISNNPTLDTLTEIHEYNCGLKLRNEGHLIKSIGCVVSLGTGRIPVIPVESVDVFRPEGIFDVKRVVTGFTGLVNMMVDQATLSEGPPVNRSRAWCSMLNIPFYRFSPRISEDFPLDCHDNKSIITMMWETQCYIVANREKIQKLGILLKNIHDAKQKSVKTPNIYFDDSQTAKESIKLVEFKCKENFDFHIYSDLPSFAIQNTYGNFYFEDSQTAKELFQLLEFKFYVEVPKESVGTICSILRYSEENFKMVKKLFTMFAQKSGSMKCIPQTLFRELQGISDINRNAFLTHSYNHGLQKGVMEIKNAQKKNKLQKCFMTIVGINDLDICKRLYPDGISGIDKYLELEMPGAHIPHVFIEYCKKAVDSGDIEVGPKDFQPVIKFNVKIGNIDISNLELVKTVTNKLNQKFLQELIKNEMKIKIDLKNLRENDDTSDDICYEIENDNDNINCSTDSFSVDDSGLPESLDSSELQDTDTSISSITEKLSPIENGSLHEQNLLRSKL